MQLHVKGRLVEISIFCSISSKSCPLIVEVPFAPGNPVQGLRDIDSCIFDIAENF